MSWLLLDSKDLKFIEKEGPFSVMVFDYMMPNMNGAEFLMEVRKFDQDVVAIFLSGATNFESATHAVKNGKVFVFFPSLVVGRI